MLRAMQRRRLILSAVLSLPLIFVQMAAASGPGDLDTTWDTDGKVTTDFGGNDVAQAMAIQGDGKAVVVGVHYSSPSVGDFALARYTSNGSLDTSFGGGTGKVTTHFSGSVAGGGVAQAWAVALYPSSGPNANKIIVAGDTTANGPNDFALARYNADGTLDTSFGTGGKVTTNLVGSSSDQIFSVVIQSDGAIVAAGSTTSGGAGWNFTLARYTPSGVLDTSFGAGGVVTNSFGNIDYGTSLALQSDGKIVVAGLLDNDFAVVRYATNGTLDTTAFGGGTGMVRTDFGADDYGYSVAIQSDGKIVVAGRSVVSGFGNFALARYNTDGTLDTSFGTGGKVTTNFGNDDYGYSVAIASDGKLVAAGYSNASGTYDFAVARYLPNGALDSTWDTDGKVTTDFGGSPDVGYTVAILPNDGKVLVAGNGGPSGDFAVARYFPGDPVTPPTAVPGLGAPGVIVLAVGLATILAWSTARRRGRSRGTG